MPNKRDFIVLTDSACDLPEELEKEHKIDVLNFSIEVGGIAYYERADFSPTEFYEILRGNEQIPKTAQIPTMLFLDKLKAYDTAGVRHLLYVSINGSGSATCGNALMAKRVFAKERPTSTMGIYIVDSHSYSMGCGWYVAKAAEKLEAGEQMSKDWKRKRHQSIMK